MTSAARFTTRYASRHWSFTFAQQSPALLGVTTPSWAYKSPVWVRFTRDLKLRSDVKPTVVSVTRPHCYVNGSGLGSDHPLLDGLQPVCEPHLVDSGEKIDGAAADRLSAVARENNLKSNWWVSVGLFHRGNVLPGDSQHEGKNKGVQPALQRYDPGFKVFVMQKVKRKYVNIAAVENVKPWKFGIDGRTAKLFGSHLRPLFSHSPWPSSPLIFSASAVKDLGLALKSDAVPLRVCVTHWFPISSVANVEEVLTACSAGVTALPTDPTEPMDVVTAEPLAQPRPVKYFSKPIESAPPEDDSVLSPSQRKHLMISAAVVHHGIKLHPAAETRDTVAVTLRDNASPSVTTSLSWEQAVERGVPGVTEPHYSVDDLEDPVKGYEAAGTWCPPPSPVAVPDANVE